MKAAGDSPADRRLIRYVALGFLASAAFVVFDLYSESMIGAGTMSGRHAGVHFVVDHLLPLVIGPLLGVAAHYVRLRSRLTRAEESAAMTAPQVIAEQARPDEGIDVEIDDLRREMELDGFARDVERLGPA